MHFYSFNLYTTQAIYETAKACLKIHPDAMKEDLDDLRVQLWPALTTAPVALRENELNNIAEERLGLLFNSLVPRQILESYHDSELASLNGKLTLAQRLKNMSRIRLSGDHSAEKSGDKDDHEEEDDDDHNEFLGGVIKVCF